MDYSKYKQQRNNIAMQRIEADRAAEQYNSMYPNAAPLPSTTGNMMNTIIPVANDTNSNYAPKQMLKSGGKMKMYTGGTLQDPPRDTIPTNPLYPTLDLPNMGSGNNSYPPALPGESTVGPQRGTMSGRKLLSLGNPFVASDGTVTDSVRHEVSQPTQQTRVANAPW